MKRSASPFAVAAVLGLLALVALLIYGLAQNEDPAPKTGKAPGFTASRLDGKGGLAGRLPRQGRGAQLLGIVVRAVPRRVAAARPLAREGVAGGGGTVLGVDVLDVSDDAREFVREYGLELPDAP